MQAAGTPRPRSDEAAPERLRANLQAAAAAGGDKHPGHWHLHHIALPTGVTADFTPYPAPDYVSEEIGLHEPLFEWLAELFGFDHAQGIEHRGLDAGREAGQ